MSPSISYDLLSKQNAETSTALIAHYEDNNDFTALSTKEGADILARDNEDAEKLQVGIDYAKKKGVIDPNFVPEEYITIDVLGKTPSLVADEILAEMGKKEGESVIVICGLSGTGKGTTVSKLMEKIEGDKGRSVVCWSNGNIFRSVTLLAATWCEQQDDLDAFDADKALTKENLASFMGMLEFGKVSFWFVELWLVSVGISFTEIDCLYEYVITLPYVIREHVCVHTASYVFIFPQPS